MNLSVKKSQIRVALILCGSLIYTPMVLAQNVDSTDSNLGCNLSLALTTKRFDSESLKEVEDLLKVEAQAHGYVLPTKNWEISYYGDSYNLAFDYPDFKLMVNSNFDFDIYNQNTKAESLSALGRNFEPYKVEYVWTKESIGNFYCQEWKGWAAHYNGASQNPLIAISGTFGALVEWIYRCDENRTPYEFVSMRLLQVLNTQLSELPTCEAAKKLPPINRGGY